MSRQVNALERCPYEKWCGGCSMQGLPYKEQLKRKEKEVADLLKAYGRPESILGMNFTTATKPMRFLEEVSKERLSAVLMREEVIGLSILTAARLRTGSAIS